MHNVNVNMTKTNTTADAGPAADLHGLVVKDHVHLGGLAAAQRLHALGLVWAALPSEPMSEREVNTALRAALQGPAIWLDTDHVELRRWLVDTGWLQRDGFGHCYQRLAPAQLRPELQAAAQMLARVLGGKAVGVWVAELRTAQAARRAARRQAWVQAGAGDAAGAAAAPR